VNAKSIGFKSRDWLTMAYHPMEIEEVVRRFWDENDIRRRLHRWRAENNRGVRGWVEGPPTLNGVPHVGHARGRVIKDLRFRFSTMQGYYIPFRAGWDCQGLPVELEAEKALGFSGSKKELLEKVGEERLVEECKKTLDKYYKFWMDGERKLGMFMDYENAYWTYKDEYIEREWQYLKRAWEQGLLDEDYYVVAYCPSCQTSLSHAEVGLGYEEVEDPSLYFKFKVRGREREYLLMWTTMPFTLVTDMMVAVHPDAEYARVRVGDEVWIMARGRVEPLMEELGIEEYEVLEVVRGRELEGLKYEFPFLDIVPEQRKYEEMHPLVRSVVCEDFVDVTTATGIVHMSPGNGEEDFEAAVRRGVPVYAPFDDECRFTDAGIFRGVFARDADEMVVEELRKRGLLVKIGKVRHEYPTCWRSHHKLIWVARREYFLRVDKLKDLILKAAENVEYYYEPPRNRFLSILSEGRRWCISRERIWGTPLPIWVCEKCGEKTFISSKKELMEKAIEKPEGHFELHKPWIDRVVLRCEKCGGRMYREPFVIDVWHNSGAAPYAGFTDEEFKKFIPAYFLVEAIDQTRGWANSLLLEHVILTGRPESPYRAFLFYGFVLDAKGRKMSKSLGNVIVVNELLEKHPADVCRFYLLWKCSPIETMNFDIQEMYKRPYQVLNTLYHLHRFFMQNAEYDGFNPVEHTIERAEAEGNLRPPDRWLLSKLQQLISDVTRGYERCQFHVALSGLEEFVIEVVSRGYIPMVRRELWSDDPETLGRRLAIYATLWRVLRTLVLLFNPITPFISEFLHQAVYRQMNPNLPESVNFEEWPTPDETLRDPELEKSFEYLEMVTSLVYSARQSAGVKRRWPLRKVVVVAPSHVAAGLKPLSDILLELANVKELEFSGGAPSGEGWASAAEGEVSVYLDVRRDELLIGEGLMRDLARRVQALRREMGFMPTEILEAAHIAGLEQNDVKLLEPHLELMRELVRVKRVELHTAKPETPMKWREFRLDGRTVHIAIQGST